MFNVKHIFFHIQKAVKKKLLRHFTIVKLLIYGALLFAIRLNGLLYDFDKHKLMQCRKRFL